MVDRAVVMIRADEEQHGGECACGEMVKSGDLVMGYRGPDGYYWYVCLMCHFWHVHTEQETAA